MPRQSQARFGRPLSYGERQILLHVATGHTVAAAAELLGVSYTTARTHMYRAQAKLGAYSASHAIAIAIAARIIHPDKIPIPKGVTR